MAKFLRGRNKLATCKCCGKLTHSSLDGYLDAELCRTCLESSGFENEHSDGGHVAGTMKDVCATCNAADCMHEVAR